MSSLLNSARPPVFCPGCAHERVVHALDHTLQQLNLDGSQVAIVTDIGCAGLFDTFFNTHALHGLHGRALTYATGLKLARPELTVITIMGDGGLGIGGAHLLAACRRNLDLTLLVLNNFNYGMTGGQFSSTTPADGITSSGFLGQLEMPLDLCRVAAAAGAPWVARRTVDDPGLAGRLAEAIRFDGFALLEVQGLCTGRYTRKNPGAAALLERTRAAVEVIDGEVAENWRPEYGGHYRRAAELQPPPPPVTVVPRRFSRPPLAKTAVLLLGAAGQRVNTAGEILCLAAMSAGLVTTQKNDYPITVLRGHSISEVMLSAEPIGYTGIDRADIIVALAQEGVARRRDAFARARPEGVVIASSELEIPATAARVVTVDFQNSYGVAAVHRALAALALLVRESDLLSAEMLRQGLQSRFAGKALDQGLSLLERVLAADEC